MIDYYTIAAIVIRALSAIILLWVLIKQIKLLHNNTRTQWVKYVLTTLVVLVLLNAVWSLSINFFRDEDGNLINKVRHYSLIFNASSGLLSAIGWAILYKTDKQ